MKLSAPSLRFTLHALLAAAGLVASLSLGACSRVSHVTDSLVGPVREGSVSFASGGNGRGHNQPMPAVPTPSTPANGAVEVSANPTLVWNAATGASSYRVQVSSSSGFSGTVVEPAGGGGS